MIIESAQAIASELWLCCELHMESDDVACLYNNRLHF